MNIIREISNFFHRIKYPVSLPEEVLSDLGFPASSKHLIFMDLLRSFTRPNFSPSKLKKFMSRDEAEKIFYHAKRRENFRYNTLFSYYFNQNGWLAFDLVFDDKSRLRRLYVKHQNLVSNEEEGVELPLPCNEAELKKIW